MSFTPAKPITSSQEVVHVNLVKTVRCHMSETCQRPIAAHNQLAFDTAYQWWQSRGAGKVILDSACGAGESTRYLANTYPDHCVIGLDQSQKRLSHNDNKNLPDNCILLRCECMDFWKLADNAQWFFDLHTLYYPNPYPKPKHLQRRWHGEAAFKHLIAISQNIELRSNWKIYVEEFYIALTLACQSYGTIRFNEYFPEYAITAFERKYLQSQHSLWQVSCQQKSL